VVAIVLVKNKKPFYEFKVQLTKESNHLTLSVFFNALSPIETYISAIHVGLDV